MVSKKFWGIMAISALHSSFLAPRRSPPRRRHIGRPARRGCAVRHGRTARAEGLPRPGIPASRATASCRTIDIERAVTPYLGEGKTIKDIEAARQSLEKLYHDHGYQTVLVNIPQQEVSAGIVRLKSSKRPSGRCRSRDRAYHSLQVINATVPQLKGGVVPNFGEVQRKLAQVNHTEDLHVTPVLRASTTPGQVDVDLDVQDELPLHASLEADNRYSANTAQLRMIGEVSYDNLFQRNQSMSVQYQVAPEHPDEAEIWSVSYVIPTQSGLVWALYAVRSNSNIAAVGDLDVIGNGSIYGVRLIEPLPSPSADFLPQFHRGSRLQGLQAGRDPAGLR